MGGRRIEARRQMDGAAERQRDQERGDAVAVEQRHRDERRRVAVELERGDEMEEEQQEVADRRLARGRLGRSGGSAGEDHKLAAGDSAKPAKGVRSLFEEIGGKQHRAVRAGEQRLGVGRGDHEPDAVALDQAGELRPAHLRVEERDPRPEPRGRDHRPDEAGAVAAEDADDVAAADAMAVAQRRRHPGALFGQRGEAHRLAVVDERDGAAMPPRGEAQQRPQIDAAPESGGGEGRDRGGRQQSRCDQPAQDPPP